jgi:hypothetical protein
MRSHLIVLFCCIGLIAFSSKTNAQFFSPISTSNITKIFNSSIVWADLDNDGDLDFVSSGSFKEENHVTTIYKNLGNDSFAIDSSIYLTSGGWKTSAYNVYCVDFDNDGWIDVLLIGITTKLYRNLKGKGFRDRRDFTETGNYAACSDFNNDGLIDIAFSSAKSSNYIDFFENKGGFSFEHQSEMRVEGGNSGNIDWGDYNNDGYPDLVVCGRIGNTEESRIYKNKAGKGFEQLNISLEPAKESASKWADFNNDGKLDLLIVGRYRNAILQFYVYRNNGNDKFTKQASRTGLTVTRSALGDFDKDGDLDVFVTGSPTVMNGSAGSFTPTTYFYQNGSSKWSVSFSSGQKKLMQVFAGDISSVDFDNDNDLDFMLTGSTTTFGGNTNKKPTAQFAIYKNTDTTTNKAPSTPTRLAIKKSNGATYLHWKQSTDDHTSSTGLTYNIVLGTKTNPSSIFTGDVRLSDGRLKIQKQGNIGLDTISEVGMANLLFDSSYYARIQSIDNSFVGSKLSDTISIPVRIQASLVDEIKAKCGDKIVLPLQVFNNDSGNISHSWFPSTDLSDSKVKNPSFIASESRYYKVTSTASNGEKFIDSIYIDVDGITLKITNDTSIICGNTLKLSSNVQSPTSADTNFIYQWSPSTGLSDTTLADPKLKVSQSETIRLTVSSKDGCIARDSIKVSLMPLTVEAFDSSKPCEDTLAMSIHTNAVRPNLKYNWSPNIGLSASDIRQPLISSIKTRYYTVTVSDSLCVATDSVLVTVTAPNYTVTITPDTSIICGNTMKMSSNVRFTNSDTTYSYHWSPSIGLSDTSILEPELTAYQSKKYSLSVRSSTGCIVRDTVEITLTPLLVEIQNISKPCGEPDTIPIITNAVRTNLAYSWSPSIALSDTNTRQTIVSSTSTQYYYVTVRDSICIASDSALVTINPADYKLDFSSNEVLFTVPPFALQCTNLTPDFVLYDFQWDWDDDSILVSNNAKVFHEYQDNGLYSPKLTATKKSTGCSDTILKVDYIYCTGKKTDNVEPFNKNVQFEIYPNPATGIIHLEAESYQTFPFEISILNSLGQRVWEGQMTQYQAELDLRHLPRGVYSIVMESDEFVISKKVVLN